MSASSREFLQMRANEHQEPVDPSDYYMILSGKVCPYCSAGVRKTTESEIYGRTYKDRSVIVCNDYPKCDSYVGCHKDGRPLGRLADGKLRQAKKECHQWFDKMWMPIAHIDGVKRFTRKEAYAWLSDKMELHPSNTHIGMFDLEQCKKATSLVYKLIYPNK